MVPESGVLRPAIDSTVVVLPAPFGPRMPKISPSSTEKDTPSTAARSPYRLVRSETSMTFMAPAARTVRAKGIGEVAGSRGVVGR